MTRAPTLALCALVAVGLAQALVASPARAQMGRGDADREQLRALVGRLVEERTRRSALAGLSKLGPAAGPAATAVVEVYADADAAQWERVVRPALARMGRAAIDPVAELLDRTEDPAKRQALLLTLADLSRWTDEAARPVAALLARDDLSKEELWKLIEVVRAMSFQATPAAEPLGKIFIENRHGLRPIVFPSLSELGEATEATFLAAAAAGDDPDLRGLALQGLGYVKTKRAVDALVVALAEEETPELRARAAESLGWCEERAASAAPELARAVADDDARVRGKAVGALSRIGIVPEEAIAPLLGRLEVAEERLAAIGALGRLRGAAVVAVPRLVELLHADGADARDRFAIVRALGLIGSAEAVPALRRVIEGDDRGLRVGAARALGGIGAEAREAVPTLLRWCEGDDAGPRAAAIAALGGIGKDAAKAAPTLAALAEKHQSDARALFAIVRAIGAMGDAVDPEVIESVVALAKRTRKPRVAAAVLQCGEAGWRHAWPVVREAIRKAGPRDCSALLHAAVATGRSDEDLVDLLVLALGDPRDPSLRAGSARMLAELGDAARGAAGPLIGALEDDYPNTRVDAARTLAKLGPHAEAAGLPLRALADRDPVDRVRAAAREAIAILEAAGVAVPTTEALPEPPKPILLPERAPAAGSGKGG